MSTAFERLWNSCWSAHYWQEQANVKIYRIASWIVKIILESGNDQTDNSTGNNLKTDTVNYLGRISSEPVTKCDKVDKLQALWQPTVASFPKESTKPPYVNEGPASLNTNHYESPIKLRNISVTSNSENDLRTSTNERPQSYIDMQGKKSSQMEDLLVFSSVDDDKSDNNVTNWSQSFDDYWMFNKLRKFQNWETRLASESRDMSLMCLGLGVRMYERKWKMTGWWDWIDCEKRMFIYLTSE